MLNERRIAGIQAVLMILGILLACLAGFFFYLEFLFLSTPPDIGPEENRMLLIKLFGIGLIPAILSIIAFIAAFRVRMPKGRCVRCGYDLRSVLGPCPECGRNRKTTPH